jgi:hypothetical protein
MLPGLAMLRLPCAAAGAYASAGTGDDREIEMKSQYGGWLCQD